jgi:hypothetical protein
MQTTGIGAVETEAIAVDFFVSVWRSLWSGLVGIPVLTVIGDCGSCTWCLTHDGVGLDALVA